MTATEDQKSTTPTTVEPPARVHFLGPLALVTRLSAGGLGDGIVTRYGQELDVTEQLVLANTDRNGRCALVELVDDPEGQVDRYGRVMYARGSWPAGRSRLEPGSDAAEDARESARRTAHSIQDASQRAAALAAVNRTYGPAPTTSRTVAEVPGDQSR